LYSEKGTKENGERRKGSGLGGKIVKGIEEAQPNTLKRWDV